MTARSSQFKNTRWNLFEEYCLKYLSTYIFRGLNNSWGFTNNWLQHNAANCKDSLLVETFSGGYMIPQMGRGRQPIIWPIFSQKLHRNERNLTERGACVPGSPGIRQRFLTYGLWLMADWVIFHIGQLVDKMYIYAIKVDDRGLMSLMICRGHIRASKSAFHFFVVNGSMGNLMAKSNFALLSSFQIEFERVINGLGGQKLYQRSI